MKLPRVSIAFLTLLVVLVAADIGILRQLFVRGADDEAAVFIVGFLPMANVLALSLFRLLRRRGRRMPFTRGFVAGGSAATAAYVGACILFPSAVMPLFGRFALSFLDLLRPAVEGLSVLQSWALAFALEVSVHLTMAALFFTLPPLLFALASGIAGCRTAGPGGADAATPPRHAGLPKAAGSAG